ncbi:hypothetical protein ACTWQB_16200 [Piscibacillus sp. B03]|uniref:hypothetical protein n=1 Tax=Piscibacillus sp. B03 TaxID=3457430 RepID=UPI003FCE534B
MARKSLDKVYRKFVTAKDDYQRFELVERLNDHECREMLFKIAFNLLPTVEQGGGHNVQTSLTTYSVVALQNDDVVDRSIGQYTSVLAFINQYQHMDQVLVYDSGEKLRLKMENGQVTFSNDQQLFLDVLIIMQRERVHALNQTT